MGQKPPSTAIRRGAVFNLKIKYAFQVIGQHQGSGRRMGSRFISVARFIFFGINTPFADNQWQIHQVIFFEDIAGFADIF